MRQLAAGSFGVTVLMIAAANGLSGLPQLGILTLALGIPLAAGLLARLPSWVETLFLGILVALVSTAAAAGLPGWWIAAALPLAIFSWDLAQTARQLEPFDREARRCFAWRYAVRGLFHGIMGFLLVGLALQTRLRFGFGLAIALVAGTIYVATLVVRWLWSPPANHQRSAPSVPQEHLRHEWHNDGES